MPTKKKRHTCHICKRKLIKDKILIIKKQKQAGGHGKYICKDCKEITK